jgi:post-GPI attachment to proteins factor 2
MRTKDKKKMPMQCENLGSGVVCMRCGSADMVVDKKGEFRRNGEHAYGLSGPVRLGKGILMTLGAGGPAIALFLCLVASYLLHWEHVTSTHCKNWQFWPSISSIIGNHAPQKYIWRFGIALSLCQRLHDASVHWQLNERFIDSPLVRSAGGAARHRLFGFVPLWLLKWITYAAHFAEQFFLLLLTYVSSTEDYDVHEMAFILFSASATTLMVSAVLLDSKLMHINRRQLKVWRRNHAAVPAELLSPEASDRERALFFDGLAFANRRRTMALASKVALLATNQLCFAGMAYAFYRHGEFCEDGVYSIFALLEWIVVATNILFHSVVMLDFAGWTSVTYGVNPFTDKNRLSFMNWGGR